MKKGSALRWIIWSLAAFFYFYEYLLRVTPSIIVPELMQAFKVSAGSIGLMSAFYFYAYAPMQLPVGVMIDHFGARKLLTFACLVCAIGSVFFGLSHSIWTASFGRLLVGVGSSFAFVSMVFVCSHWFDRSKQALLVGLANSIGMLGAVCGEGPLALLMHHLDWRVTVLALAAFGVLLALIIFTAMKQRDGHIDPHVERETSKTMFEGLKIVSKSGFIWLNAIIALLSYMLTSAIGELWGVPFIQTAYGVSKHTAGFVMSMLFVGWLVGGPIMGLISDKLGKRRPVFGFSIFLNLCVILPVIYLNHLPIQAVYFLMFLVGVFSSGELLNFTFATELTPYRYKGSAIAFTNFIVSLGSSIIQPAVGYLLDLEWSGTVLNGIHIYSLQDYRKAFLAVPIMMILGIILCFFLKEKKIDHDMNIASKSS